MRRNFLLWLEILALAAGGWFPATGMTVADLQAQQATGAKITVIDIRSPQAFAREHIPGAINVPASLCPRKMLPPLGRVVVCGDGLGDAVETAAASLAAKPGLNVEILDGGLAAWKTAFAMTTRGPGLKREELNYISYARLKAARLDSAVLVDLRKQALSKSARLTDLATEFPGARQAHSRAEAMGTTGSGAPSLLVLIDSGDGTAEAEARHLKSAGVHNYVILAGGELILARHGQAGLQRASSGAALVARNPASKPPSN